MAAAAAAAACRLSVAQLAKLERLDDEEAARLDTLVHMYCDTHERPRLSRVERGEGASRSRLLKRIARYPHLVKARSVCWLAARKG